MTEGQRIKMVVSRLDYLHDELTRYKVRSHPSAPHLYSEIGFDYTGKTSDGVQRIEGFIREYNRLRNELDEIQDVITNLID